jgi:hypothetical protein
VNALRPGPWAGWVAAVVSALRAVWPRPTPPPQELQDPDWRCFDRPTVTRRGARIVVRRRFAHPHRRTRLSPENAAPRPEPENPTWPEASTRSS